VNRFLITGDDMYLFIQAEIDQRPIYIDVFPVAWSLVFKAVPSGHLYRLERPVNADRIGGLPGGY
jgi:hypothetical protein